MLLLCSMGRCSGQLVRSFLLAVKPQHAHISIHWPSSVQLCSKQQKSVCEYVVQLYSQASFLLKTPTQPPDRNVKLLEWWCGGARLALQTTSEWYKR